MQEWLYSNFLAFSITYDQGAITPCLGHDLPNHYQLAMAQVGMMNIKRHSNDPKKFFLCSIPFCVFSGASEFELYLIFPPVFVICSLQLLS